MDALKIREWEGDKDPRMKSIQAFGLMVENLWRKPLSERSCLSRAERKCIRNVIRDYMRSVEPLSSPSGMPVQWLLEECRDQNPYFQRLIQYDKGIFLSRLSELRAYYNVETVGQYVLFMVFCILRVEFLHGSEFVGLDVNSSRQELRHRLTHAFVSLLTYGTYINHYENSAYMFIGAPMYWAQYVDYYWAYKHLYENAFVELLPSTKMYRAYFEYVRATIRHTGSEVRSVMLRFCGETWAFSLSAPEFILEALCYTVADTLEKTDDSRVLLYVEELHSYDSEPTYLYHELGSTFREVLNSGVPGTRHVQLATHRDISAISIEHANGRLDNRDWYFPVYKLVTPSLCGQQLVLQQYVQPEPARRAVQIDLKVTASTEKEEGESGLPDDEFPEETFPGSPELPEDEPPSRRVPDDFYIPDSEQQRVQIIQRQIRWLEHYLRNASKCCHENSRIESRLRHHLETMRQYSVLLSRKTDIQSGLVTEVWPSPHAVDGSWPRGLERPPKALLSTDLLAS